MSVLDKSTLLGHLMSYIRHTKLQGIRLCYGTVILTEPPDPVQQVCLQNRNIALPPHSRR